jgi:hypothetical protein
LVHNPNKIIIIMNEKGATLNSNSLLGLKLANVNPTPLPGIQNNIVNNSGVLFFFLICPNKRGRGDSI